LKEILYNSTTRREAVEVIREVTDFKVFEEDINRHYFYVTLEKVTNDDLLDVEGIKLYLSTVAPVAYSSNFSFRNEIYSKLKELNLPISEYEYNVHLNNLPIFKNYTDELSVIDETTKEEDTKKSDKIQMLEYFEKHDNEGSILFYGWFAIRDSMSKMVHNSYKAIRGFRLRKHNIQIGDENSLDKFFKRDRWNDYFIGEIFVFNKELIPNARRDFFVENEYCVKQFQKVLREVLYGYSKLPQDEAAVNSLINKLKKARIAISEFEQKQKENSFEDEEQKKLEYNEMQKKKKEVEKTKIDIENKMKKAKSENSLRSFVIKNAIEKRKEEISKKIEIEKTVHLEKKSEETKKVINEISNINENKKIENDVVENKLFKLSTIVDVIRKYPSLCGEELISQIKKTLK